ncbi:MAG: tol-pal system YbgF family protein, partial [Myxococcota bacterium]
MIGCTLSIVATLAFSQPTLAQTGSAPDHLPPDRPPPGMLLTSIEAEDAIIAGRNDMMAFRMDAAEATFETLLREPGNDEAALYHLAALTFVKAMIEQNEPAYTAFFERSDALLDLVDDWDDWDDRDRSAWLYFFDAENYLMRAFVYGRKGNFLRSAVSAREAYEVYLDALRADPTLIDAESGIGLLKAMIGATPPAYKKFLKLLGYTGTIEEAVRLLDHASSKARYNGSQAALFRDLTSVYMNKDRGEATERLAIRYREDKNPATGLMYAFALRYSRKPEEAVDVAREGIKISKGPEFMHVPFLYFHLGSALFSLNRFEEAASELDHYVRVFKGQSYKATAQVRLGLSLEMMGRREEAEFVYQQIEAPTEFDIDVAAERAAGDLIASPLSENRKILLRGRNAVSSGRSEEALAWLEPVFFGPDADDADRTEAAYWLGRAHHVAGNLEAAATKYVYVRTHPAGKDLRWWPWATYYLGRIRATENRP